MEKKRKCIVITKKLCKEEQNKVYRKALKDGIYRVITMPSINIKDILCFDDKVQSN